MTVAFPATRRSTYRPPIITGSRRAPVAPSPNAPYPHKPPPARRRSPLALALATSVMPPRGRNRRRQRRSPPELVFGFSREGRQREEAFWRALDGNAEYEDALERDRMAEEQRTADLRRQQSMEEEQRTAALRREQSARNWADYVEAGARQIALEAVGHARARDAEFYYQLVKWVSRLEAEASVDHAGMERANGREQRALSHLWQVRREEEDVGAGV